MSSLPQDDLSVAVAIDSQCPLCEREFAAKRWLVIDLDRRPELVVHACDGSLQRSFCPHCIGPGVEHRGSFCVVARVEEQLQCLSFLTGEGPQIERGADQLSAALDRQLRSQGATKELVEWVGSRWLRGRSDAHECRECITDHWTDFPHALDSSLLVKALPDFLRARDSDGRAAALLAEPDLARPNVENLLESMKTSGRESSMAAAETALRFIADARRIGAAKAAERSDGHAALFRKISSEQPELAARLRAFLEVRPETLCRVEHSSMAAELASALVDVDARPLAALVWQFLGDLARHPFAAPGQRDFALAIDAFERAWEFTGHDEHPERFRLLLKLAACWDERQDGDRTENLECALAKARDASVVAESLSNNERAEAAMEVGILYTRRLVGDPAANLTFAREQLQSARDQATEPRLRTLAGYNDALTYIEAADANAVRAGVAMLRVYEPLAEQMFEPSQQRNLYQSLASGLARLATTGGPDGDRDDVESLALLDEARGCVHRAIEIARSQPERSVEAYLCGLLARIESDRLTRGRTDTDFGSVLQLLDDAGKTLDIEHAPYEYARNELFRGSLARKMLPREEGLFLALGSFEKACRVVTSALDPDLCRRAHSNLGSVRWHLGDIPGASAAYATACAAAERVFARTESVAGRAKEVRPNAQLYADYVDTLAHLAHDATAEEVDAVSWRALEAMERGRARLTLDLMGLRPLPSFVGVSADLRGREEELLQELAWSLPGASDEQRAPSMSAERLHRQRRIRQELDELWNAMEQAGEGGRRYVELRRARPLTEARMAAFAGHLGPRAAILTFYVLGSRILGVWLQGDAAPQIHPIDLPRRELERWLERFRHDVVDADADDQSDHEWLALGNILFEPFTDLIEELDLLVIVPHGALHRLPLHALDVRGAPLIQRVPVVYGPSLAVIMAVIDAEHGDISQCEAALVGSYAECEEDRAEFVAECEEVANLLATTARPNVTKERVSIEAPRAHSIHLVCHAFFDEDDPLGSGVELSDGLMTAREWLQLSLVSDLVTLSACETGKQHLDKGDELSGLPRALLQAGAASVLMTMWRVYSDAATDWMSVFYGELRDSPDISRAEAFRRATLALREHDSDPRAWAAFLLIGDPGTANARWAQ